MAYLGFLFEFDDFLIEKSQIVYNDKIIDKKFVLVFVEVEKLKENYIVGFKKFKKDKTDLFFLEKYDNNNINSVLKPFFIFENSIFRCAKICLAKKEIVEFESLGFWFGVKKYKELYDLFLIRDIDTTFEDIIRERVAKISIYFKL